MKKALRATALLAGSLLVASCASATPADPPSASGEGLIGVTWLLEDVGGKAPVDGSPATVRFSEDGAMFGSGGCNRFTGTYEAAGSELTVGDSMPATMMACADDVMALEQSFLTALAGAGSFAEDGDGLTLSDTDGAALATFTAQTQDLADTTWNLASYNNGKGGVQSLIEGTAADITFSEDGTISGTGGCNRLFGSYTAADGIIGFGTIASTAMACPAPEGLLAQEAATIAALESAATYSIEGDTLEMRTADGATALRFTRA